MRFGNTFGKSIVKNVHLPKMSSMLQFLAEIKALKCPDLSIQSFLILSWFSRWGVITLGTLCGNLTTMLHSPLLFYSYVQGHYVQRFVTFEIYLTTIKFYQYFWGVINLGTTLGNLTTMLNILTLQSTSTGVDIFFSLILSYFCFFVAA